MRLLYAGGQCTCRPGRYVRYVIPRVPGCKGEIHCRANDAPKEGREVHEIPRDAVLVAVFPADRHGVAHLSRKK